VFQHVSFRYPGSEQDVLNDISFTIQPGETVALVGENGAGKTTLVKLLTRLYDPSQGTVTIAGRDLRQVDPQLFYQQIGAIFQDFRYYNLTVKENIGFGNLAELENMARIRRAAEMGGATELIEGLPHQYETMLGRVFLEDSKDLSGGEWQKIALARAFMRDVPLLILDEPTAALDAFAENTVYNRFAELTKGRTTIFVTHRLSSVRMAGRILVLKEGRLIEAGNHDELMAQGGEYASMFKLQAERYQSAND
jgi:ATP-binding cassette subfamily B protein